MVAVIVTRANTYTVFSVCLHTPEICRYDLSKPGVHGRGKSGYSSVKKRLGATNPGLQSQFRVCSNPDAEVKTFYS